MRVFAVVILLASLTVSGGRCDTDASCAALGGEPGYGVTAKKILDYKLDS